MTSTAAVAAVVSLAAAFAGPVLVAGAPGVPEGFVKARVEAHSAAGGLRPVFDAAVRGAGAAWIGYAMPARGVHQMCCWRSVDAIGKAAPGCRLEKDEGSFTIGDADDLPRIASAREFAVLLRVEGGQVRRIRMLSRGCAADFGGLPLHWIDDVRPADSLSLLESLVGAGIGSGKQKAKGSMDEPAMAAIAMHDDAAADALLEGFADPARPLALRKQAVFWMGHQRGRRGYEAVRKVLASDEGPELREHAVFALSQSDVPEAVDAIVEVARSDRDAHVRGQALFWLGQAAGKKAVGELTRAIDEDPETEVKKKAVFAVSQLPKEESVPLLIKLAREHRNPAVRKQAMFWLGQSGDPQALAFFEEVLR
jgi:HEAT repeat protein